MMPFFYTPQRMALPFAASLLLSACGDDGPPNTGNEPDASQPAGQADASGPDAGSNTDAAVIVGDAKPKPACQLLSAEEVAAILGTPQRATELVAGMQCQYSSLDPERKDVRGLLEVVTNGRAIYAANLQMFAEAGKPLTPQSGIGDQAAFRSDSAVLSSMQSTVGDVLLRLNLGWGEPGVTSDTQLAGERTLMLSALGRL